MILYFASKRLIGNRRLEFTFRIHRQIETHVTYTTPRYTGNFAPDEVYLQSMLVHKFGLCELFDHRIVDLKVDGIHAKELTTKEFTELLDHRKQATTNPPIPQTDVHLRIGSGDVDGGESNVMIACVAS